MNVDTGFMGEMDEVRKRAKPGERVIPATIIPARGKYANKHGATHRFIQQRIANDTKTVKTVANYGPRKPLREVRAELQAEAAEK